LDYIAAGVDGAGFNGKLAIAPGTYDELPVAREFLGFKAFSITSSTNAAADVVIKPTTPPVAGVTKMESVGDAGVFCAQFNRSGLSLDAITLDNTDPGYGGWAGLIVFESILSVNNCVFTLNGYLGATIYGSRCNIDSATWSGSGDQESLCYVDTSFLSLSGNHTIIGSPYFNPNNYSPGSVAAIKNAAVVSIGTFTGTCTGSRFYIAANSVIQSYGTIDTNLPGSLPGFIEPGGLYIDGGPTYHYPDDRQLKTLEFISSTNASPQDGQLWFDGTNLKMQVGGVIKSVVLS
jgi:hypothetical protein